MIDRHEPGQGSLVRSWLHGFRLCLRWSQGNLTTATPRRCHSAFCEASVSQSVEWERPCPTTSSCQRINTRNPAFNAQNPMRCSPRTSPALAFLVGCKKDRNMSWRGRGKVVWPPSTSLGRSPGSCPGTGVPLHLNLMLKKPSWVILNRTRGISCFMGV